MNRNKKSVLVGGLLFLAMTALLPAQSTIGYAFFGTSNFESMGQAVSGAGDVNGDGFDDVIVASPGFNATSSSPGLFRVFSGSDGSLLHIVSGTAPNEQLGYSVSDVGDVNNDGFDDFIVGAPGDTTNGFDAGRADVYSGFDGSILLTFLGTNTGNRLGSSVSGAGDVDGDGTVDLIVGMPFANPNGPDSGRARVFSGATGATIYTFKGDAAGDQMGYSVSDAGDYDGDGRADLVVGAPLQGGLQGIIRVFSGMTGAIITTISGGAPGPLLGWSVSGAGDVNDDGFDDVVAGAPGSSFTAPQSGAVWVFSGADNSILHGSIFGVNTSDSWGYSVSGAGDVNGDGFDDFMAGSPFPAMNGALAGLARVYSGADGSVLDTFDGSAPDDRVGISVSGAGDVNLDGFADFIVGSSAETNAFSFAGAARVFLAPQLPILNYSSEIGVSTLDLSWAPDNGNINSVTGTLTCTGATPGASGIVGISASPANLLILGFPLLIAIDSTNLLDSGNFGFGFLGELTVPNVSRQNPFLAGLRVHIQMYESAPSPASSNGIQMLMVP